MAGHIRKIKSKKKGIRYQAYVYDTSGRYAIKTFDSRRDADSWCAKMRAQRDEGNTIRSSRMLLAEFFNLWMSDYIVPQCKPVTISQYTDLTKRFVAMLGNRPLKSIKPLDIQQCVTAYTRKFNPNTTRYHFLVLKAAFNKAIRWKLLPKHANPVDDVSLPDEVKKSFKTYDPEQLRLFEAEAKRSKYSLTLRTLMYSGKRISEVLALRAGDVNTLTRDVVFRGNLVYARIDGKAQFKLQDTNKTGDELVPTVLNETLFDELAAAARGKNPEELLFTNQFGQPLDFSTVRRGMNAVIEKAKLPHIRIHDLRRTFATVSRAAGGDISVISKRLGHSNTRITEQIYSRWNRETDTLARDQFDQAIHG